MQLLHFPQCSIQNRNVHISVLNGALWDMELVHSGICELGQLLECSSGINEEMRDVSRQQIRISSQRNWRHIFCGRSLIYIFVFQKMPRTSSCMALGFFLLFLLTCNRCHCQHGSPRVFQANFQAELDDLMYSHDGGYDSENITDFIILPNYLFFMYPNVSVCFIQYCCIIMWWYPS